LLALLYCIRHWLMADPWIFSFPDCKGALLKVIMSAIPNKQGAKAGNSGIPTAARPTPISTEKEGKPKKEGKMHLGFGSTKRRTAKSGAFKGLSGPTPEIQTSPTLLKRTISHQLQVTKSIFFFGDR